MTLDIADFSSQLVTPAMQAFAQKVDTYLTKHYVDFADCSGTAGATPAAVKDILAARTAMNINKVPTAGRNLVIDPVAEGKLLELPSFHEADKMGDSGTAMREASLGRKFGFNTFMDQNIQQHIAGKLSAAAKPKADTLAGAELVTLSGTGMTGELKKGDLLKILSRNYVVLDTATATTDQITVKIFPALQENITTNTAVIIAANHTANLAFHKNAIALVTRPLALPNGVANDNKAIVNYDGFGLRVVYGYDIVHKTDTVSIDMLCGTKTIDPRLGLRVLG